MGKAAALLFAGEGAAVAVIDIDEKAAAEVAREITGRGGKAFALRADVSNPADAERMVEETVKRLGKLNVLYNNAGIEGEANLTARFSVEGFDRVIGINLRGVWLCLKYEVVQMLKQDSGGAIVNLSSAAGLVGSIRSPAYGASKHGVVGLTKSVALQLAKNRIRVNAVCPGGIMTPMTERIAAASGGTQAQLGAAHPLGRMGQPEEIASAVLWLCSDQASYVTGFAAAVDGGLTAM